jgi:hypothetical protein
VAALGDAMNDKDLKLRRAVVDALQHRHEDSTTDHYIKALQDQKAEIRRQAVLALGARLEASRAGLLSASLKDPDSDVRTAAIYSMAAVGGATAVSALSDVVAGDYKKEAKALAAECLGQMGSREALPALVAALDDADKNLLAPALQAAIHSILAQTPARVKAEESPKHEPLKSVEEPAKPVVAAPKPVVAPMEPKPEPAPAATPEAAASTQTATAVAAPQAKSEGVPVNFKIAAPQAQAVQLSGSFPGKKKVLKMVRDVNGNWNVTLRLPPGSYRYQFLVDGHKTPDPESHDVAQGFSLITVPKSAEPAK